MRCDLTGKVSLITGAARGIGQAIADRLAENGGASFIPISTKPVPRPRQRPRCQFLRAGCHRPDEIAAVIERIVAEHGQLDILVNNAGVNTMAHRVTIDEFPRDEWDRILAVDLTGLYEVSRAAARVMRAAARAGSSTSRRSPALSHCGSSALLSRPRRASSI